MENNLIYEKNKLIKKLQGANANFIADIHGGDLYPKICGSVSFYDFDDVCLFVSLLHNMPATQTNFFAIHIHENGNCEGDFSSAGEHFDGNMHPNHKGDLPLLLSCDGNVFSVSCTNRFRGKDIVGRTVIIHAQPDDYTSQPAGNSGKRIACGLIKKA